MTESSACWWPWPSRASEFATTDLIGRSHNVPAQITTLGKRFASAAEELLGAYERLANA